MIKQEEGTEWRRRGVCASDTHTLVSEPKALATASAACMSRVEKDETKCNDKSETKKAHPGLQVGLLCFSASFPFTPSFLFPSALQHVRADGQQALYSQRVS